MLQWLTPRLSVYLQQQQGQEVTFWPSLLLDFQKLYRRGFCCVATQSVWLEGTVTDDQNVRFSLVRAQSGQNESALLVASRCRPSSLHSGGCNKCCGKTALQRLKEIGTFGLLNLHVTLHNLLPNIQYTTKYHFGSYELLLPNRLVRIIIDLSYSCSMNTSRYKNGALPFIIL